MISKQAEQTQNVIPSCLCNRHKRHVTFLTSQKLGRITQDIHKKWPNLEAYKSHKTNSTWVYVVAAKALIRHVVRRMGSIYGVVQICSYFECTIMGDNLLFDLKHMDPIRSSTSATAMVDWITTDWILLSTSSCTLLWYIFLVSHTVFVKIRGKYPITARRPEKERDYVSAARLTYLSSELIKFCWPF